MIVIDASAFLEVLMRSTSGLTVEALLEDTMAATTQFGLTVTHVPTSGR